MDAVIMKAETEAEGQLAWQRWAAEPRPAQRKSLRPEWRVGIFQ